MNFYVELTDEEVAFIKYVLTLSKDFAKQIFKNKVIFTKTVRTSDGRCEYNVEQTSEGPCICIKITPAKRMGDITFSGRKEFHSQYSSYNPWTSEATCVEILSVEDARRKRMKELKKLVLLATHLREFIVNGETRYYSINQKKTLEVINEDKIVATDKNKLITTTIPLSCIMEHPEIYGFYTMVPTEAITEEIKNMLE